MTLPRAAMAGVLAALACAAFAQPPAETTATSPLDILKQAPRYRIGQEGRLVPAPGSEPAAPPPVSSPTPAGPTVGFGTPVPARTPAATDGDTKSPAVESAPGTEPDRPALLDNDDTPPRDTPPPRARRRTAEPEETRRPGLVRGLIGKIPLVDKVPVIGPAITGKRERPKRIHEDVIAAETPDTRDTRETPDPSATPPVLLPPPGEGQTTPAPTVADDAPPPPPPPVLDTPPAATPQPSPNPVSSTPEPAASPSPTPIVITPRDLSGAAATPTPGAASVTAAAPPAGLASPAAAPGAADAATTAAPPSLEPNDLALPNPAVEPSEPIRGEFTAAIEKGRTGDLAGAAEALRAYGVNHSTSGLAPRALFLSLVFEPDPARALDSYRTLREQFPTSPYIDEVTRRRLPVASIPEFTEADARRLEGELAQAGDTAARLDLRRRLAAAYVALKQYDKARPVLDAALPEAAGKPQEPQLLDLRSEVQIATHDIAGAMKTLTDLLQRFPAYHGRPKVRMNMGLVSEAAGQYPSALANYRYLIEEAPDSAEARFARERIAELERFAQ